MRPPLVLVQWPRPAHLGSAAQVIAEQGRKHASRGSGRPPKRPLFTQWMLRCSLCSAPMSFRARRTPDKDVYVCATRRKDGPEACPMPIMPRTAVDGMAFEVLSEWAIDFEATRDRLLGAVDERVGKVDRAAASAERGLRKVQTARERTDRLLTSGELAPEAYSRIDERLTEEVAAAQAEHDRLTAHLAAVRAVPKVLDDADFARRFLAAEAVGGTLRGAVAAQLLEALRVGCPPSSFRSSSIPRCSWTARSIEWRSILETTMRPSRKCNPSPAACRERRPREAGTWM
jgi:hypothetical protein